MIIIGTTSNLLNIAVFLLFCLCLQCAVPGATDRWKGEKKIRKRGRGERGGWSGAARKTKPDSMKRVIKISYHWKVLLPCPLHSYWILGSEYFRGPHGEWRVSGKEQDLLQSKWFSLCNKAKSSATNTQAFILSSSTSSWRESKMSNWPWDFRRWP